MLLRRKRRQERASIPAEPIATDGCNLDATCGLVHVHAALDFRHFYFTRTTTTRGKKGCIASSV